MVNIMLPDQQLIGLQKILAVDDNSYILRGVKQALEREGYEVVTAVSGEEALSLIKKTGLPHLALVDLNMPGMDGFELCEAIFTFSDLPIIMLTAIDDEQTIVESLDKYAEDYITKPFRPAELAARVRRVLRRVGSFNYTLDPVIAVDDYLQVDFPERKAIVNRQEVNLTPTESRLLYILMRNAGHTVTNHFLLKRAWPMEDAYEDRLHTHIYRLRRKIEPNPKDPKYVISQWGAGYTFPAPNQS